MLLRRGGGVAGACGHAASPAARSSNRRLCVVETAAGGASASLRAREGKLGWVPIEHRKEVAQCVEMAERAAERWTVSASPAFVAPPVASDALEAIKQALGDGGGAAAVVWGGYAQAERCRVVVGPRELLFPPTVAAAGTDDDDGRDGKSSSSNDGGSDNRGAHLSALTLAALADAGVIAACQIDGNFMFDPATHRDFLGAVLGTGISRDKVGDIVGVSERGAVVLVDPLLVEHLEAALESVRSVPVKVRPMPLSELRLPAPRVESLKSVEASLRLDAVASAGFRVPRAKMADLIKAGNVKLQWRVCSKASVEVKQGDVVSVAGKGRLEVVSVSETKNKRWAVEMVRRS